MPRFENKICPVCRAPFNEKADVVVCPVCGTPHHRQCWMIKNECALHRLHGSFQWNGHLPDEPEQTENTQPDIDMTEAGRERLTFSSPEEMNNFVHNFLRALKNDEIGRDGVSLHELSTYVGSSSMHYCRAFSLFRSESKDGRKPKVFMNFCSGFFAPVFQFYRKMDWLGIIVILLQTIIMLPVIFTGVLGGEHGGLINTLISLGNVLSLAQTVVLCLFGDYLYYLKAVRQIKKIRARFGNSDEDIIRYYEELSACGRPSWLRAIIGALAETLALAAASVLPMLAVSA